MMCNFIIIILNQLCGVRILLFSFFCHKISSFQLEIKEKYIKA